MNQLAIALNDLYKDLNSDFLNDLKAYSKENYSISLFDLIEQYSIAENEDQEMIENIDELKKDNSISSMEDFYQLIDYMFENMEG